jgi:hypothetical protein
MRQHLNCPVPPLQRPVCLSFLQAATSITALIPHPINSFCCLLTVSFNYSHNHVCFNSQGYQTSGDAYHGVQGSGQLSLSSYSQQASLKPLTSPQQTYELFPGNQESVGIFGYHQPHPDRYTTFYSPFEMSDTEQQELAAVSASAQDVAQNALASTAELVPRHMSVDSQGEDFEPFSPKRGYTHKRNEEPPKNDDGKMVCKYQKTQCPQAVFDRKCEWS